MMPGHALMLLSAMAATAPPSEITPKDRWEDLGVPVRRSRIYSQAVGRDTRGREVYYLGFGAVVATVVALDPRTGKGRQLDLLGKEGTAWGLCAHSNGKGYVSLGSGWIFELDPVDGNVRLLGRAPEGEQVVWELHEAADGNLYGGTYPSAKLVRVNVRSGTIEDLGRIDADQMYVRIDPATRRHEVLATHPGLHGAIVLAGDYLYGFKGTRLVRLRIDQPPESGRNGIQQ